MPVASPFARELLLSELPGDFNSKLGIFKGNIWYVDSAVSASGSGKVWTSALETIDEAINKASAGDTILVADGHAETIAAADGIAADVAGISIIGLGQGTRRPTLTLSAVGSTVSIGAASVRLKNFLFLLTADATIGLDINSTDAIVEDCEFRNAAAKEAVTWIDINGGAANACDRTTIRRCVIRCPAVGSDRGIELGEVADNVVIEDCVIDGDFTDAAIHNPTGKILTKLRIARCVLRNTQTGDHALELVSACTGTLAYNEYYSDLTQATAADPGSCFSIECYHDDVIDACGILSPAAT